jgi:MFS family permease
MREGFSYAAHSRPIRSILILIAAMSLIGMPYGVLMPVVAKESIHGGAEVYGLLMAASGLGAVVGAMMLAARRSIVGLAGLLPYCTIGFGISMLFFGRADILLTALPLLFLMGFTMMYQNASCNTVLQTVVETDKRGRVMSLYTMSFMGMAPLGSLSIGAGADRLGTGNTLGLCGLGCVGVGLWFLRGLPALRRAIRPIYRTLGILPEAAAAVETTSELSVAPERAT